MGKSILYLCCFWLSLSPLYGQEKVVNIYGWAYSIPLQLLQKFESETGIKVNYDVYDSPEVMETKLLAGSSGYDLVMVTIWPYLERQLKAKLYQPLNRKQLSTWSSLNPDLLKRMEQADPENTYALPFLWGTTGFCYNRKMIEERDPKAPNQSSAMLFDPKVVARFVDCGVLLLDSPTDVMPAVLAYLGRDPNSDSLEDLKKASKCLTSVRPFIRKFQAIAGSAELISRDYCIVQGFSGELLQAQKLGKKAGLDLRYVIPEEGSALWLDGWAIPKDANHLREAYAFLNFILRPENIAHVTNALETANGVPSSLPFIEKNIRENPLIYPSQAILDKLYVDKSQPPRYERARLREWTRVKIGR